MDDESPPSTDNRFTKKKIRLSQVVDKLAVLGNGVVFTDKENNNVPKDDTTEITSPSNETSRQVPQTNHVVQQTACTVPEAFLYRHTTSVDSNTSTPSPQIGSTVPNFMSATDSAALQKILLYGRYNLPSDLYRFANHPFNFWQLYLNSHQKFASTQIPSLTAENYFSKTPSLEEKLKEELDDDEEGVMVIDESWNSSNNIQRDQKTPDNKNNNNNVKDMKEVYKKISGVEVGIEEVSPPNIVHQMHSITPQIASSIPQMYHEEQPPASTYAQGTTYISTQIPSYQIPVQYSHSVKEYGKHKSQQEYNPKPNEFRPISLDAEIIKVEPKLENYNRSTDIESEMSWKGTNPSPMPNAEDQYQRYPLDLSVKGMILKKETKTKIKGSKKISREPIRSLSQEEMYPEVRGDVASPTTRETVAARYNIEVSPVVEQMPDGSDTAWACTACGQLFSQRDRLAKHVACRHRGRSPSRSHVCWSCNRGFSRSDMLTRHLRLHTGQKPYRCAICGQIFSRSDHLATHRRTHTGEKPYKCPQCSYSACRRDMITRHLRTHRSATSTSPTSLNNSPPIVSSTTSFPAVGNMHIE